MTPVRTASSRGRRACGWIPAAAIAVTLVAGCGSAGDPAPFIAATDAASAPPPVESIVAATGAASAGAAPVVGRPPDAALAADGGDPVVGALGAYTTAGGGSDAPWLAGAPIAVGAGEPLAIAIDGSPAVSDWTIRLAPAASVDGTGGRRLADGTGTAPIAATGPGPGDWTLALTVRFAVGGSASYYWRLTAS